MKNYILTLLCLSFLYSCTWKHEKKITFEADSVKQNIRLFMYKDSVLNLKFNNLKPNQIVKEYKKIKIFNDKKLLLLECIYSSDIKLRILCHYKYNYKNQPIKMTGYTNDSLIDFYREFKYDKLGNKIYELQHDYAHTLEYYWIYDKHNKVIEEKLVSSDSTMNHIKKNNTYFFPNKHLPHF